MPQTIANNPSIPQTTITYTPAPYITEEICYDGIDNNRDNLIDFSDRDCNPRPTSTTIDATARTNHGTNSRSLRRWLIMILMVK